jgi:uncharacterized membrane protein
MVQFLASLVAPALWAASNHLNKYLLSRYMRGAGVGAIVVFAALVGVVVLPVSALLQRDAFHIGSVQPILIALNGCLYLVALTPFLKALRISDASSAIPILQVIPVLTFILARIFLGETLSSHQLIGGSLILCGAVLISLEMRPDGLRTRLNVRADTLGLMLLSALCYAVSFLLFKVFATKVEFWTTAFWESVGFIGYAAVLLTCVRPYREEFLAVFPSNRMATVLAMLNEVINIAAKISFNYFSLWGPITLTWLGVSFQSVFVLLYSILLAKLCPHISKESVDGKQLMQKILAIAIMLLGACIMLNSPGEEGENGVLGQRRSDLFSESSAAH